MQFRLSPSEFCEHSDSNRPGVSIEYFGCVLMLICAGVFPAVAVERDELPVPAPEELRGGPGEQEPVPVLPAAEVHGAWNVAGR